MFLKCLYVGIGGSAGAILRYAAGSLVHSAVHSDKFPLGTLAVNVAGCLAFGIGYGVTGGMQNLSEETRAFVFVGLLGGFTTYSSFGFETVHLLRAGNAGTAATYVALSLILGIGAVWLGMLLTGQAPQAKP